MGKAGRSSFWEEDALRWAGGKGMEAVGKVGCR